MADWTKVVTDPLGLAGFAIFVVLVLVAATRRRDRLSAALVGLAGLVLIEAL